MENSIIINSNISADLNVNMTPSVTVGDIKSYCFGEPYLEKCTNNENCYMVNQLICVQFPLALSVQASAVVKEVSCNEQNHDQSDCLPIHSPRSGVKRRKHLIRFCSRLLTVLCGIKLIC